MFLTSEPLADSVLAPRRDRLHARSPAAVAAPAPRRPGRLLPLRAAGGGKSRWWSGVGRWRVSVPLHAGTGTRTGTGRSSPLPPTPLWLGTPLRTLPFPYYYCSVAVRKRRDPGIRDPSLLKQPHPPPYLSERCRFNTSPRRYCRGGEKKGEGAALQLHSCLLNTCGLLHALQQTCANSGFVTLET